MSSGSGSEKGVAAVANGSGNDDNSRAEARGGNASGLPAPLTAGDRESFAYPTIKDRVPIIICKVIDLLHRQRLQLALKDNNALKQVLELMSKLRYELATNKPFAEINDEREDAIVWNEYMQRRTQIEGETPKWFNTTWLYAECYAYRRLVECSAASSELRDFDYFGSQKRESFRDNLGAIDAMAESLVSVLSGGGKGKGSCDVTSPDSLTNDFRKLLETSLWGNKCDLSISAGDKQECSSVNALDQFRSKLLVDDWQKVWECLMSARLSSSSSSVSSSAKHSYQRQTSSSSGMVSFHDNIVVDIVMDNAGFELFSDLCLADFLIATGLASHVRLRVKVHPWFVSDTSQKDIDWVLCQMAEGAKELRQAADGSGSSAALGSSRIMGSSSGKPKSEPVFSQNDQESAARLRKLADKWSNYLTMGSWEVHSDPFWTYPHDFSMLESDAPDLYRSLSEASLIIFKGDLNYRKLVGDRSWDPTTPFKTALQGFHPAPIVSLRTLKADVVAGLGEGQAEKAKGQEENWMTSGNWGLIQFCDKL